jgi:nucleoside-diphosphate-sugar epimerase
MTTRVLVTGAGGFIGHHLVGYLRDRGYWVRGADLVEPAYTPSSANDFQVMDLRERDACEAAVNGIDEVYHLAADMGGIGYITAVHAAIAHNNTLINTNILEAARKAGVQRLLFSSSACVYPAYRQEDAAIVALREDDAIPADPEAGYGWEKLFMEQLCRYYREDYGLKTRIARFHNVYGPLGTYDGGREKAPAAISRKIALASDPGTIEVWGDGEQTRSFLYVADCVEAVHRLMRSDYPEPLNIGTERLVTINELVDLVAAAAGKQIEKVHDRSKPQGVRGRNSDNTRVRAVLGWEPQVSLEHGLGLTYSWILEQLQQSERTAAPSFELSTP